MAVDNRTSNQLPAVTSLTDADPFLVSVGANMFRLTYASLKTLLTAVFNSTFQPLAAGLTSLAALGTAANKMAYTTAKDTWAETAVADFGRARLADADAAAARTALDVPATSVTDGLASGISTNADNITANADAISALDSAAAKLAAANVFTKTQTWKHGSDVASATSLTLGDGNVFDITGTTDITSIATKGAGTIVILQFDGVLTLTHDGDNIVCPGAASIVTAAGSIIGLEEYATGKWRVIFQNSGGSSGNAPYIDTAQAATSGSSKDFTIPSWATAVTVSLDEVSNTGTGSLRIQLGDSGGVKAAGYSTEYVEYIANGTWQTPTNLTSGFFVNSNADVGASKWTGELHLVKHNSSDVWVAQGSFRRTANGPGATHTAGRITLSGPLTTVRLNTSAGALDAGSVNVRVS